MIFSEARALLALHFVLFVFSTIPRNCNGCAHELARSGLTRDPDLPCVWEDPLPSFVTNLVDRDRAIQCLSNKASSLIKKTSSSNNGLTYLVRFAL